MYLLNAYINYTNTRSFTPTHQRAMLIIQRVGPTPPSVCRIVLYEGWMDKFTLVTPR